MCALLTTSKPLLLGIACHIASRFKPSLCPDIVLVPKHLDLEFPKQTIIRLSTHLLEIRSLRNPFSLSSPQYPDSQTFRATASILAPALANCTAAACTEAATRTTISDAGVACGSCALAARDHSASSCSRLWATVWTVVAAVAAAAAALARIWMAALGSWASRSRETFVTRVGVAVVVHVRARRASEREKRDSFMVMCASFPILPLFFFFLLVILVVVYKTQKEWKMASQGLEFLLLRNVSKQGEIGGTVKTE